MGFFIDFSPHASAGVKSTSAEQAANPLLQSTFRCLRNFTNVIKEDFCGISLRIKEISACSMRGGPPNRLLRRGKRAVNAVPGRSSLRLRRRRPSGPWRRDEASAGEWPRHQKRRSASCKEVNF